MSRENLIALHRAFREASKWPEPVRETVIRWLADSVRPNGRERRSPVAATVAMASQPIEIWPEVWRPRSKQQRAPKPKPLRPHQPDKARILELRLLEAMRSNPGASVAQLAAIAGCGKSRAQWRMAALAARGEIEKDITGRWKLKGEEPREAYERAMRVAEAAVEQRPKAPIIALDQPPYDDKSTEKGDEGDARKFRPSPSSLRRIYVILA